ncbi:MAG: helix-turn-helix domain-containing protein [FCB group bacterium]|nr:helix-turn-helix domain-containing protein [FCB group bacterium]
MENKEILNLVEACRLLQIRKRTMYQLLKDRKIPGIKIGGQWRFRKQDIFSLFSSADISADITEEDPLGKQMDQN